MSVATNNYDFNKAYLVLSPGQTDSQGNASQLKFAKSELAYGLAKGGQTDSQVGSQVARSRKFHAHHWLMRFYNNRLLRSTCVDLRLGGHQLVSTCAWVAKR